MIMKGTALNIELSGAIEIASSSRSGAEAFYMDTLRRGGWQHAHGTKGGDNAKEYSQWC